MVLLLRGKGADLKHDYAHANDKALINFHSTRKPSCNLGG